MKTSTRIFLVLLLDVVIAFFASAGVYQAYMKPGLGVTIELRGGRVTVDRVALTPASPRLRGGDTIVAVNGIPAPTETVLETIIDEHAIDSRVRVDVIRNGRVLSLELPLVPYYGAWYLSIAGFVSLLYFGLGLFVFLRRTDDPAPLLFHLAMNAATALIAGSSGRYTIDPIPIGYAVQVYFTTGYCLLPAFFIHFTLHFPRQKWEPRWRIMLPTYALAVAAAALAGVSFLRATYPGLRPEFLMDFSRANDMVKTVFSVGSVLAILSFVHSYRTAREEDDRKKLRWVLFGSSAACLTFVLFWFGPKSVPFIGRPLLSEELVSVVAAAAPITFAIAIIRHRVLDIDLLLSRSTVYAFVLGLLVLADLGLVALAHTLLTPIWEDTGTWAPLIAAVIIALLFEPARARVQRFVDRRFFRNRYNLRQAQHVIDELALESIALDRLANVVAQVLDGILAPETIGVYGADADMDGYRLFNSRSDLAVPGSDVGLVMARDASVLEPGRLYAAERWIEGGLAHRSMPDSLEDHGIACVVVEAVPSGGAIALVAGPRKAGTRYSLEDLDLYRTATAAIAAAAERIQLQQDLIRREAEAERLRELDRMRSYFVSSVTHELKTPITSIRMFAEMLETGRAEQERVRKYARVIDSESQRLGRLIDTVLDFSRIERGVKEYRRRPTDLHDILDLALNTMEYQITSAGFTLDIDDHKGELPLVADADALVGAVINLVSNAIKYSADARSIEIRTFKRPDAIGVTVADHGIGMSAEDQRRIFDPFFRAEAGKATGAAGTGLGLALVQHVVEAHGGRIELQSQPGRGSSFTLLFPLKPHHEEYPAD